MSCANFPWTFIDISVVKGTRFKREASDNRKFVFFFFFFFKGDVTSCNRWKSEDTIFSKIVKLQTRVKTLKNFFASKSSVVKIEISPLQRSFKLAVQFFFHHFY